MASSGRGGVGWRRKGKNEGEGDREKAPQSNQRLNVNTVRLRYGVPKSITFKEKRRGEWVVLSDNLLIA